MSARPLVPTVTELPNGQIVVMAGKDQNGLTVTIPEVVERHGLAELTDRRAVAAVLSAELRGAERQGLLRGEQRDDPVPQHFGHGQLGQGRHRLYGTRDYGAAVMYLPGKILYVGGGRTTRHGGDDRPQPGPARSGSGPDPMAYPRRHLNATMLPTGEVLVTGGTRGTSFNEPSLAVRVAEIWNPGTGVWTQLASNAVNRGLPLDVAAAARRAGAPRRQRRRAATQTAARTRREERRALLPAVPLQGHAADDHERASSAVVRRRHHREDAELRPQITQVSLIAIGSVDPRLRLQPAVHVAHLHPRRARREREGARHRNAGAAWLLHAVHPERQRRAVGGKDDPAALGR